MSIDMPPFPHTERERKVMKWQREGKWQKETFTITHDKQRAITPRWHNVGQLSKPRIVEIIIECTKETE
jgi:hypothetical protein